MMDRQSHKKNFIAPLLCALLWAFAVFILKDGWEVFDNGQDKTITIGCFSDSYWEVQNGYAYDILEDAIEAFQKSHPNVEVKFTSGVRKKDYSEWLAEQILAGDAPDLYFVLPEDFNYLIDAGALKDLTSLIEEDASFEEEAFYSSVYQYGQYENRQYALPYECAPKLMFVNKTILDEAGIAMPEGDWSWEDFYEICEQVTKDTDGDGVTDRFGVVGYTWQDAFDSNGVRLFSDTGTTCYFSGTAVEESLTFLQELESLNSGYSVTSREFDLGNVAFQPMSFSEYRAYRSYPLSVKKYSGFEWGCIPMPAGPNGDNISRLDTLLLAISKDTKQESLAWEFMKTLVCSEEIQSEIFSYSEGVSVLRRVTESDQTLEQLIESSGDSSEISQSILGDAVENAVVAPRFRGYEDALEEVDRAVADILDGDAKIANAVLIWNRTLNKKLKNNTAQESSL